MVTLNKKIDPLAEWALHWGVGYAALADLRARMGVNTTPDSRTTGGESSVVAAIRLEASRRGAVLWRNNSGVAYDKRGVPVRFGLCNDSAQLNRAVKSSDLIGLTADGRFLAVEAKAPGWHYTGNAHERAQLRFLENVRARGGVGFFTRGDWGIE